MNKLLLTILLLILTITISHAQTQNMEDLFKLTDKFMKFIKSEEFEQYDLWGENFSEATTDSSYLVIPYRGIIDVRINREATEKEYAELQSKLQEYYKQNKEVREVYINNGGTVTMDCKRK